MSSLNLGRVVMTAGVARYANELRNFNTFMRNSLTRHRRKDWGSVGPEDSQANDHDALEGVGRIVSSYPIPAPIRLSSKEGFPDDNLWIITTNAGDQTYTTILWPSEY